MKIYDISMEIKEDMIVYPGNPSPKITRYANIPKQKTNESRIILGSHTGTHVDAPLHIKNNGISVKDMDLYSFYGECKVLDLTNSGREIKKEDLENKNIRKNQIILLKTRNSIVKSKKFDKNFSYLSREGALYLLSKKIKAVGADYLSIKKYNQDDDVHELLINNMIVFEGLNLNAVSEGEYTFIGFPIKVDADGAPLRAVLIQK